MNYGLKCYNAQESKLVKCYDYKVHCLDQATTQLFREKFLTFKLLNVIIAVQKAIMFVEKPVDPFLTSFELPSTVLKNKSQQNLVTAKALPTNADDRQLVSHP